MTDFIFGRWIYLFKFYINLKFYYVLSVSGGMWEVLRWGTQDS